MLARTDRPERPDLASRRPLPDAAAADPRAFLPRRLLEVEGDRSVIDWDGSPDESHYRITDDPDGLGLDIEWLGTRLSFRPESPVPLLPLERRMVEVVVQALDLRFRGLFDQDLADRLDRFQYVTEDLIVADFLGPPSPYRDPRRARGLAGGRPLDLREPAGLDGGPLARDGPRPGRPRTGVNTEGAPRFNARLTAIKGFHRLCDGVQTLFLVDLQGNLVRMADIEYWADQVHGSEPPEHPCPRLYLSHAKATGGGGHVCLVLTPSQEIKVFAGGTMLFTFSDARWRLLDIPSKFAALARGGRAGRPIPTWPSGSSRPRST